MHFIIININKRHKSYVALSDNKAFVFHRKFLCILRFSQMVRVELNVVQKYKCWIVVYCVIYKTRFKTLSKFF